MQKTQRRSLDSRFAWAVEGMQVRWAWQLLVCIAVTCIGVAMVAWKQDTPATAAVD